MLLNVKTFHIKTKLILHTLLKLWNRFISKIILIATPFVSRCPNLYYCKLS